MALEEGFPFTPSDTAQYLGLPSQQEGSTSKYCINSGKLNLQRTQTGLKVGESHRDWTLEPALTW